MARARPKDVPTVTAAPKNDAFTGLMFVSVAALLGGCAMLAYVLSQYDWTLK